MGNHQKTSSLPERVDISAEEIADTLVAVLLTKEVRAGMRLRSMHDLSEIFRTDYRRVHNAVGALAERGILTKRPGSGTYIRRLPTAADAGQPSRLFQKLDAGKILSLDGNVRSRRRPLAKSRNLEFQFWADTHWKDPVRATIIQGVEDVLSPLGHRVTICGVTDPSGTRIDERELVKKLRAHPADGYLTMDWVAESYGEQFAATGKLWLTWGFSGPLRHQPGMILDCIEAVERGTQALIEGGCRRVALLGWFSAERRWESDFERFYYSHALRHAGIEDYNVAVFVRFDADEVRQAFDEILDGRLPADGIYLADDNLLPFAAKELERRGMIPGRDLGVVTLWNEGLSGKTLVHEQKGGRTSIISHEDSPFVSPYDWSRMEQSPRHFGRALAHNLVSAAQSANARLANHSILADWRAGKTHLRTAQP